MFLCYSCSDDDDGYKTFPVSIQLVYPTDGQLSATTGVKVTLTDTNEKAYTVETDAGGKADFILPSGVYNASVTDKRAIDGYSYTYNGSKNGIALTDLWTGLEPVEVTLSEVKTGQIVIKELYVGGCQKDDGSGVFQMDKYVILYNNSDQQAKLDNLCLGMVLPYNSHGSNNDYVGGSLLYANEGWIPAGNGIWYFQSRMTMKPGEEVVIALNGAIDHTPVYSNSIDFANPDYYCTYDPASGYSNTSYYPAPSSVIPASHYLLAKMYGAGNAWALSTLSPAFFVFHTDGVSPADFVDDPANENYYGGTVSKANARRKVPTEWILDGIEVFTASSTANKKRLTPAVDGGAVYLEHQHGHALYRNVDKESTEALAGNQGKLVYSYSMGTTIDGNESTDPSGIDAEASIRNGARIIYQDTNNSTNDFHQRKQASLRD
nr:DUF4876 domain-containing protein [Dysgonomonas sp. 25]